MNFSPLSAQKNRVSRSLACGLAGILMLGGAGTASAQLVTQSPLSAGGNVPGNLFLVPSVEFPTVISAANIQDTYSTAATYVGYFDARKCYKYNYDSTDALQRYFYPVGWASSHACSGSSQQWSGNFLNWATTQTIDPFRQALTGGYRVIDTTSLTVLEKARYPDDNEDYFYNRRTPNSSTNSSLVSGAIGTNAWNSVVTRVARAGNRIMFTGSDSTTIATYSSTLGSEYTGNSLNSSDANTVWWAYARVKVCDPAVVSSISMVESNCVQYGSNYKPEGLIQKYASRMRYSVFAYLNDSNMLRDGGVMRARMKFVGPQKLDPSSGNWVTNTDVNGNNVKEWDESTGIFVQNPDSVDAANTQSAIGAGATQTLNNSGVINYVNKFGEMTNTLDKSFDPVSEMYYAALRYLRGKSNISAYSDLSGTAQQRYNLADGFPVITNWDEPLQYYCQNNAFLGIGDVYTHRDKNLNGNTRTNDEPSTPPEVTASGEPDVRVWANRVAQLEFGSNMALPFSGRENSAYIAGLAYYAHTQDMRPDVTTDPLTKGMQTASTYWVDVREKQHLEPRLGNQYWLAAKYGGFTLPDPDNSHTFTTSDYDSTTRTAALPASWWDSGESLGTSNSAQSLTNESYNRASNYFTANQADKMYSALSAAFAKIANEKLGAGSSLASNSTKLDTTTRIYQALFSNGTWMGQLSAQDLDDTTGQPNGVTSWNAGQKMPGPTARTIYVNAGGTARVWNAGNMTSAQVTAFTFTGIGAGTTQDVIDYFRGDQVNEESNTASGAKQIFRVRTPASNWSPALGDIVNSTPIFVGAPNPALYIGATFSGASAYGAFATAKAGRTPAIWVGANDGMLHAFDAGTSASGGTELYAFIPNQVIMNGLAQYANPDYVHKYFVDGEMAVADVYDTGTSSWRTVLVGTLGRGGPGVFALDVTNPNSPIFLWEKGPSAISVLGRNIGRPVIAQVADGDWRVILGNGVDSTAGAQLVMIGAIGGSVTTMQAESTSGNGLSAVLARDNNGDGFVDTAYAGDLQGNLWKFGSLTGTITATKLFQTPTNLAASFAPFDHQRITAAPFVARDPQTSVTWVFFGTGQFLNSGDIISTSSQSWYGIKDSGTLVTQANLVQRTFTDTTSVSGGFQLRTLSTGSAADLAGKQGWYIDLPISGERMVLPNRFSAGILLGTSLIPDAPDACKPTGRGVIMAINPYTGARLDMTFFDANRDNVFNGGDMADTNNDSNGDTIVSGLIDDAAMTQSINVGSNILWQDMEGGLTSIKTQGGAAQAGRLSWREITN
jgi:type IV pilus assembly protein PilY1